MSNGREFDLVTDDKGVLASPVLKNGIRNILIDIDGTICDDVPNEEPERMKTATPYKGAKEHINHWYEEGHQITFFTSRENAAHRQITEDWLRKHGFHYHNLLMDKPRGGNYYWVDNHIVNSFHFTEDWEKVQRDFESPRNK